MSYDAIHHPEAIFCFGSAAVNALIEFFRARDFNQILVRLRGWWVKPMGTPNLEILSSNTLLDLCSQNQEATKKLKMRMQDTSNQASGLRTVLETMLLNFPRAKKDQKNKYNNILNYIDIYFIYHLNGYIIWDFCKIATGRTTQAKPLTHGLWSSHVFSGLAWPPCPGWVWWCCCSSPSKWLGTTSQDHGFTESAPKLPLWIYAACCSPNIARYAIFSYIWSFGVMFVCDMLLNTPYMQRMAMYHK